MVEYQTIPPNDSSFYAMLNDIVQREPIGFIDPETRGHMAEIGIVKGKDFAPDERMQAILAAPSATPIPAPIPSILATRATASMARTASG